MVLFVVVSVSVVKNGFEDRKRHIADRDTNRRVVKRLIRSFEGQERFEDTLWKRVVVGDILRIDNNQEMPADMILLTSSEQHGSCCVETSNIDGESNLKLKQAAKTGEDGSAWVSALDLEDTNMVMHYEQPNSLIYQFNGTLFTYGKEVFVDASSLLLRGSALRNTKWALGLVIYTGKDTKLIQNSRSTPFKYSSIERIMNNIIYVILAAQIIISLVSLTLYIVWKYDNYDDLDYLCYNYSDSSNSIYSTECSSSSSYPDSGYFFTFFILYSNFLPISMYVTVEICNYYQASFIDSDVKMYDEVSDTPAAARTSNMNADLGMVEYVFSDKTGTLTDNVMRFRRCSIGGVVYANLALEAEVLAEQGLDADKVARRQAAYKPVADIVASPIGSDASEFVLILALCHTVVVDAESGDFRSESPDEEALVKAAASLGWRFVGRELGRIVVERVPSGERLVYQLLATVPFDSNRKRMTVVVRLPDKSVAVYCKGADNIIFELSSSYVKLSSPDADGAAQVMATHLARFGRDGLRTLALARRSLSAAELQTFLAQWTQAEQAKSNKEELMNSAAAFIEKNMTVVGATAIEDRLQKQVPETIRDLRDAGIKVWVLTGDKVETAISVGYSAGLISKTSVLIKLIDRGDSADVIKKNLNSLINHFKKILESKQDIQRSWDKVQQGIGRAISKVLPMASVSTTVEDASDIVPEDSPLLHVPGDRRDRVSLENITSEHLSLVVDSETLLKIMGNEHAEYLFLTLANICSTVLACRVSPEQKRQVVRLVKVGSKVRPVTLSIGDGANDVAMIQEAQIGVGISGKEGKQAVNASDFAIAQFRFLTRLLLVHGRLDYRRTCKVVLFSFYKNIVLTLCLFAYTFYSGYSGQSLFDDYIHTAYNLILAWPVVSFGVFDRDISINTLETYKYLYLSGRLRTDLNVNVVLAQLAQAVVDAVIIYGMPYYAYSEVADVWSSSGKNEGLWIFGTVVYTCLVIAMFARIALLTDTWTYLTHIGFWASVALFIMFYFTYEYYYGISYNFYGIVTEMVTQSVFWWLIFLVPTTSILVELTLRTFLREMLPTIVDIGMEIDNGMGEKSNVLPPEAGAGGGDNSSSTIESEAAEAADAVTNSLKYSKIASKSRTIPLDWKSLISLHTLMGDDERTELGIENTLPERGWTPSFYNFDHLGSTIPFFSPIYLSRPSHPLVFPHPEEAESGETKEDK